MEDLGIDQKSAVPSRMRPLGEVVGSYTYFAEGDVLLAKITPCFENGKLGIARNLSNGVGFGSSEYIVFRPSRLVDAGWLYYFLSRTSFRREGEARMGGAVGHKRVALDFIDSYAIPTPPVSEQRRIVAILDEAFAGIDTAMANTAKNIENAREIFDDKRTSLLTCRESTTQRRSLGEICEIASRLINPRETRYSEFPHVGAGNMVSQSGVIVDIRTAREEGLISGKFLFDSRMVLYSKIRPYLLKACRPDFEGLCSADVYPLLPKPNILSRDFLFHILMSQEFTKYAIAGSDRAGMPKVNRDHLFQYIMPVPDLGEQIQISSKLDSLFDATCRLAGIYRNKLESLLALKQSILDRAFAGNLTATPDRLLEAAVA
jgi:type I restriction enzyme, S subunit